MKKEFANLLNEYLEQFDVPTDSGEEGVSVIDLSTPSLQGLAKWLDTGEIGNPELEQPSEEE